MVAQEAESQLIGPDQAAWLERLELEHDNMRAALEWGDSEAALRLVGSLWQFWDVHGYFREGRELLARALAESDATAHPSACAKALLGAGVLARSQGQYAAAKSQLEDALAIYKRVGERKGAAYSLRYLGMTVADQGDHATAQLY